MKSKIKWYLHRFANWLWLKTHEPTATEMEILRILKANKIAEPHKLVKHEIEEA